ncbi:hypothetical protein RHMOL_Rhmol03G0274200 [Rhododendron molle]|uniref:Uncharacterized protein n=1 Tax=Rhododendron molle TaxID=49168 RepID=A0ACC0PIT3_RHOML|nr:hypothetical protein RHMOL_Rhmol03G0274200 [Rhododendron molle]
MAKPTKSKNPLEDEDAKHKASNSSEQNDEVLDLEAGEKSPSTDNDEDLREGFTGGTVRKPVMPASHPPTVTHNHHQHRRPPSARRRIYCLSGIGWLKYQIYLYH